MEVFDFLTLESDGKMDGKCSFGGNFGSFLNDLFINNWLKLGQK